MITRGMDVVDGRGKKRLLRVGWKVERAYWTEIGLVALGLKGNELCLSLLKKRQMMGTGIRIGQERKEELCRFVPVKRQEREEETMEMDEHHYNPAGSNGLSSVNMQPAPSSANAGHGCKATSPTVHFIGVVDQCLIHLHLDQASCTSRLFYFPHQYTSLEIISALMCKGEERKGHCIVQMMAKGVCLFAYLDSQGSPISLHPFDISPGDSQLGTLVRVEMLAENEGIIKVNTIFLSNGEYFVSHREINLFRTF